MGATRSSTSRTITFHKKLGNFISSVTCDQGDVYINCHDMSVVNDPANYVPDFRVEANQRTLEMNITNTSNNTFVVTGAIWKINGTVCNDLTAYFDHGVTNNIPWLKIKNAIAMLTNNQTIKITVEAQVANSPTDTDTVTVRGRYDISVGKVQVGAYRVMIASCNTEANYTITDAAIPLNLQCLVYDHLGNLVNDNLTYEWFKLGYNGENPEWVSLNMTTKQVAITQDMVDNQAMLKVVAYLSGDKIGDDTQMVYDNQDPYMLDVTPSIPNEEIVEGESSRQQVDYKINIVKREGQIPSNLRAKVSFYLYDSVGVPLQANNNRPWENLQWGPTGSNATYKPETVIFSVYTSDFINGGTALTLDITADIEIPTT